MKDVIGYEDLYAVDEDGSVWSKNYRRTGKMKKMKPIDNGHGYLRVNLSKDGKMKAICIHRLVAQAFLPDFCKELDVDHIDRDKTNNNLSNLRMVTRQQNTFNSAARGCSWWESRQKWVAQICKDYKSHNLGYFDTEEDALAYFDEMKYMLANQMAAPNSPQWFNTGLNWAYGISGPSQGH